MTFAIASYNCNTSKRHLTVFGISKSRASSNFYQLGGPEIRVIAYTASYKAAYSLLASSSGVMLFSALYLMKSACGIDLMAGPSPFHALFF